MTEVLYSLPTSILYLLFDAFGMVSSVLRTYCPEYYQAQIQEFSMGEGRKHFFFKSMPESPPKSTPDYLFNPAPRYALSTIHNNVF